MKRKPAKMSAFLLAKIDKYEQSSGEEILPSDQSIMIE